MPHTARQCGPLRTLTLMMSLKQLEPATKLQATLARWEKELIKRKEELKKKKQTAQRPSDW